MYMERNTVVVIVSNWIAKDLKVIRASVVQVIESSSTLTTTGTRSFTIRVFRLPLHRRRWGAKQQKC